MKQKTPQNLKFQKFLSMLTQRNRVEDLIVILTADEKNSRKMGDEILELSSENIIFENKRNEYLEKF